MTALAMAISVAISAACVLAVGTRPPIRLWRDGVVRSANPGSFREQLGRRIRSTFGLPAHRQRDRAAGTGAIVVVALGVVNIGLGVAGLVGVWFRSVLQRRRETERSADRVGAALADVIDLFSVALLSGNTVSDAVRQVGDWSEGDIAAAFRKCAGDARVGGSLTDSLEALPNQLGPAIRPLVAALVATERYGAPITMSLAQLAIDTRTDRRRRAEAASRRLPVLLLFPLVICVLPAFLLVTVVPVVFDTFANFDLSASP